MQESATKQLPTVEIIRRTINNMSTLIDKQIELAMLEFKENLLRVFTGAGVLIAGLACFALMSIALIIFLILALSTLMPGWLAALVFAALLFVVGGTLTVIGLWRIRINPLGRTRETIREDVEWARRQLMSSAK